MTNRRCLLLLCLAAGPALLHAQVTTNQVHIELTGQVASHCAELRKSIVVVLDGNENDAFPADLVGNCKYDGTRSKTFSAEAAHFSLRLGIARTPCQQAEVLDGKSAQLIFDCCDLERAETVLLSVFPKNIPFSYLRRVAAAPNGTGCTEYHSYNGSSSAEIGSVQPGSEQLVLQLGFSKPDRNSFGTPIDDPTLKRFGKREGTTLQVGRKELTAILAHQRLRGAGSAPNTSSLAFDVDQKKLDDLKFERLDYTKK